MSLVNLRLDSRTFRLILMGLLGVLTIGFFMTAYLGMSWLDKESSQMVQLKSQGQSAQAQLSGLQLAKKEVQKYAYFKSVAATVIPSDKNQAEAVLEIYQMASQSGIALQSVTFPNSTLGQASAVSATAAGATANAISQAQPVAGIPGLYSLELTITPQSGNGVPVSEQVTYTKMLNFFRLVENNRRTAQITQISIQPASDSQNLSFTLTVNVFIKP